MDVSLAEAKDRLSELIRAVEAGETVVITDLGRRVAQIGPPPREGGKKPIQWGAMRDRIQLFPGWNDPIDFSRRPSEKI